MRVVRLVLMVATLFVQKSHQVNNHLSNGFGDSGFINPGGNVGIAGTSVPVETGFNDRFGMMDSGSAHGVNHGGSIMVDPGFNQQDVGLVGMDSGFVGNDVGLGGSTGFDAFSGNTGFVVPGTDIGLAGTGPDFALGMSGSNSLGTPISGGQMFDAGIQGQSAGDSFVDFGMGKSAGHKGGARFMETGGDPGFIDSGIRGGMIEPRMDPGFVQQIMDPGFVQPTMDNGFVQPTTDTGFVQSTMDTGFVEPRMNSAGIRGGVGAINLPEQRFIEAEPRIMSRGHQKGAFNGPKLQGFEPEVPLTDSGIAGQPQTFLPTSERFYPKMSKHHAKITTIVRPLVRPIVRPIVRPVINRVVRPIIQRPIIQRVVRPIYRPIIKQIVRPIIRRPIMRPVIQPRVDPYIGGIGGMSQPLQMGGIGGVSQPVPMVSGMYRKYPKKSY